MAKTKFRTKRGYVGGRKKRIVKKLTEEGARAVVMSVSGADMSSSAKKLQVFGVNMNIDSSVENGDCTVEKPEDCYIIVQKVAVNELIRSLLCPLCKNSGLIFDVENDNRCGFSANGVIFCPTCEIPVKANYLCERVGGDKSPNKPFDVNIRATLAFRGIGCGYSAMKKWANTMNMPYALSRDAHVNAQNKVSEACCKVFQDISVQTRKAIEEAYCEVGVYPDHQSVLNIGVSFDGSWQKRGFTSHNGIGSVIELLTGLPIDFEVLSNFCFKCKASEGQEISGDWKEKHSQNCPKNFDGTAGAMEVACAKNLWSRSLQKYKFRYTIMLCDGDSKAFSAVRELAPYGPDVKIEKEDCINHVSKRMGSALRNLVAESKAQKQPVSGKGKLTQEKMLKIQNYYGRAIKNHAGDIPLLKKRIMAILLHLSSTDDLPKHAHCPPGSSSWCFWQRALAKEETPGKHSEHETLPTEVGKKLVPIFQRLSDDSLLKRCVRNKTQNPNESLHNIIWRLCPKTTFVGRKTLETAVMLAICQFTMGATFKVVLCQALNLTPGSTLELSAAKKDQERIKKAELAVRTETKKRRRVLKYKKKTTEQKRTVQEGEQYASGKYNA
eukprot:gene17497-9115_t